MLELTYSLVIAATSDANFFGFYSPTLEGFTGVGHLIEDDPCRQRVRPRLLAKPATSNSWGEVR